MGTEGLRHSELVAGAHFRGEWVGDEHDGQIMIWLAGVGQVLPADDYAGSSPRRGYEDALLLVREEMLTGGHQHYSSRFLVWFESEQELGEALAQARRTPPGSETPLA
jgi:hypothetical protein